ncbi:hypothetical protein Dimus_037124, partial [Dionaea muscipula]
MDWRYGRSAGPTTIAEQGATIVGDFYNRSRVKVLDRSDCAGRADRQAPAEKVEQWLQQEREEKEVPEREGKRGIYRRVATSSGIPNNRSRQWFYGKVVVRSTVI